MNDRLEPDPDTELLACPDCDLLQIVEQPPLGGKARCTRCGHLLAARTRDPIDQPLALTLAAFLTLMVANTSPLMGLSVVGHRASTTVVGGAYEMWLQGQELTAVIVVFCSVIAPAGYILCLLAVLLATKRPPAPMWVGKMLRWAERMEPWSMIEVMMLGVLVALVKIAELATVEPGIGMYAMGVLMLIFPAIQVSLDPDEIWTQVTWNDGGPPLLLPEAKSSGAAPDDLTP